MKSMARVIGHSFLRTLRAAALRPFASFLSTGAIGISFLLVGVVYLAAVNVSQMTKTWGRGVQMVVYLEDRASPERAAAIGQVLSRVDGIQKVDYVPADVAYRRLSESLGSRRDLLEGIEVGYLPASLEVTLAEGIRDVANVSPLVRRLRKTDGVEEVEFLGDWVDKLASLHGALRTAAFVLALLVFAACLYIVASTIKLGMYLRKDELEIQKLVGATDGFVKGPLVIEGALQGILGAGAAVGLLYGLYRLGGPMIAKMLGGVLGQLELTFLPTGQLVWVLAFGMVLGTIGSFIAIGRYADV